MCVCECAFIWEKKSKPTKRRKKWFERYDHKLLQLLQLGSRVVVIVDAISKSCIFSKRAFFPVLWVGWGSGTHLPQPPKAWTDSGARQAARRPLMRRRWPQQEAGLRSLEKFGDPPTLLTLAHHTPHHATPAAQARTRRHGWTAGSWRSSRRLAGATAVEGSP